MLSYDFINIVLDFGYLQCGVINGQIPVYHTMELNIASQVKHSNVYGELFISLLMLALRRDRRLQLATQLPANKETR